MNISEFLQILRRRWAYVLMAVLLGGALGAGAYLTATPQYKSSATVYFSVPMASSAGELAQGSDYAQQQLMSYAELATQPIVLNPVIQRLHLGETPQKLSDAVSAVASTNTVLITISATDPNPQRAATIANTVADQLGQTVTTLSPKTLKGNSTVDYAIAGHAVPSPFPKSPKKKVDLGAGVLGGLIIGLLAALARDRLDTRIWSEKELVGITTLGSIPFQKSATKSGNSPLITEWTEQSSRAEAFRQLRTSLQFVDVDSRMKTITVTSSIAAEGKSGVASNLAVAFADAGHRVLLIDADLRRPAIADYFGIEGVIGLTNVLAGQVTVDEVIHQWGNSRRLSILPSGFIPPNPSELLGSNRMAALLDAFREKYDIVLIDTPPLLPVTDAAVLAARADGTVVIARYGKTKKAEIRSALAALRAVDARFVGAVINRVPVKRRGGGSSYYGLPNPDSGPIAPVLNTDGPSEEELIDSLSAKHSAVVLEDLPKESELQGSQPSPEKNVVSIGR
jgi:polysaccharide biosynthesis transport protein